MPCMGLPHDLSISMNRLSCSKRTGHRQNSITTFIVEQTCLNCRDARQAAFEMMDFLLPSTKCGFVWHRGTVKLPCDTLSLNSAVLGHEVLYK